MRDGLFAAYEAWGDESLSTSHVVLLRGRWTNWAGWQDRFLDQLRAFVTCLTIFVTVAFWVQIPALDRLDLRAHALLLRYVAHPVILLLGAPALDAGRASPGQFGRLVAAFTLAVGGYLVLRRRPRSATFLVLAVVGSYGMLQALKILIPLPANGLPAHWLGAHSFPSLYAMVGVSACLAGGYLVGRTLRGDWQEVAMTAGAVTALWMVVSASTLDLPSQVLAGLAGGVGWVALLQPIAGEVLAHENLRRGRARTAQEISSRRPARQL